jgi:hypothetical protein
MMGIGGEEAEFAVLDRADPVGADQPVPDGLADAGAAAASFGR